MQHSFAKRYALASTIGLLYILVLLLLGSSDIINFQDRTNFYSALLIYAGIKVFFTTSPRVHKYFLGDDK
jgi:hypothetical protein